MMLLSYNYFHQRESKEIKEGCASLSFNRWRTGSGNFCIFLCSLQLFPRNPCLLLASFWHLTFSFWAFPAFAQYPSDKCKAVQELHTGFCPCPLVWASWSIVTPSLLLRCQSSHHVLWLYGLQSDFLALFGCAPFPPLSCTFPFIQYKLLPP
jgi:hypothetical protein